MSTAVQEVFVHEAVGAGSSTSCGRRASWRSSPSAAPSRLAGPQPRRAGVVDAERPQVRDPGRRREAVRTRADAPPALPAELRRRDPGSRLGGRRPDVQLRCLELAPKPGFDIDLDVPSSGGIAMTAGTFPLIRAGASSASRSGASAASDEEPAPTWPARAVPYPGRHRLDGLGGVRASLRRSRQRRVHRPRVVRRRVSARRGGRRPETLDGDRHLPAKQARQARGAPPDHRPDRDERACGAQPDGLRGPRGRRRLLAAAAKRADRRTWHVRPPVPCRTLLPRSGSSISTGTSRDLPTQAFVFVISDFLLPPEPPAWQRALEHRWELVPVVVQDPVWERSFPDVGAITVPYADPETGRVVPVDLTRTEAARLRAEHEERDTDLTLFFRSLGVEPVQVASHHPGDVLAAFLRWADLRVMARGALV